MSTRRGAIRSFSPWGLRNRKRMHWSDFGSWVHEFSSVSTSVNAKIDRDSQSQRKYFAYQSSFDMGYDFQIFETVKFKFRYTIFLFSHIGSKNTLKKLRCYSKILPKLGISAAVENTSYLSEYCAKSKFNFFHLVGAGRTKKLREWEQEKTRGMWINEWTSNLHFLSPWEKSTGAWLKRWP